MAFERVTLGRTGLSVTRLGIAASYGTDEAMVEAAVERGVNYLWWGALRTKKMAWGIRAVARKGREDLVIVLHAVTRKPDPRLMDPARSLKEKGLVRFLALSSHRRMLFPELESDREIDIYHLRYNAAHRGAETEVFDRLSEQGTPGIVAFTSNRWGSLIDPARMPPGESPPSPADCYRFVLSHPRVHVACCGPADAEELRQNLECLDQGPMCEEELERRRRIGRHVYENSSPWRAQLSAILGVVSRRLRRA